MYMFVCLVCIVVKVEIIEWWRRSCG